MAETGQELTLSKKAQPDILLIIFIHGFKGTDTTFAGFPGRLQHVLVETIENVKVECILFPAYETRGELDAAVERFSEWLITLTVERESELAARGSAAKVKIVLCGHSMGGLVASDTLLAMCKSRPDARLPLWPTIIACIAFDTPFFGIQPAVFKNSAAKAIQYAQVARNVTTGIFGRSSGSRTPGSVANNAPVASSSGWGKLVPAAFVIGGALLAGAAGAVYHKREEIGTGYTWILDHLQYVRSLWDQEKLKRRMDDLMNAEQQLGVGFRLFYATLPPAPPTHRSERMFIVLPDSRHRSRSHFWPTRNRVASDEILAHMGIFEPQSNDGFYELGLQTALFIRDLVMMGRGVVQDDETKETERQVAEKVLSDTINTTGRQLSETLNINRL